MRTEITEQELRDQYDDMLNECYPIVKIGYIEFEPSRVLYEMDNIAYECGLSEYYDSICDEYICEDME